MYGHAYLTPTPVFCDRGFLLETTTETLATEMQSQNTEKNKNLKVKVEEKLK